MEAELKAKLEDVQKRMFELEAERHALLRQSCGESVADYTLANMDGSPVRLSELFGENEELVLIHNMGQSCPYCTLWAEGFKSMYPYIQQRAAFVLVSPDPPEAMQKFAAERGWTYPLASSHGTTLFQDLGFADAKGSPWPGVSTLQIEPDGGITRLSRDSFGPGDRYCSVFGFLDLLPPVEGEEWFMPDHEATRADAG